MVESMPLKRASLNLVLSAAMPVEKGAEARLAVARAANELAASPEAARSLEPEAFRALLAMEAELRQSRAYLAARMAGPDTPHPAQNHVRAMAFGTAGRVALADGDVEGAYRRGMEAWGPDDGDIKSLFVTATTLPVDGGYVVSVPALPGCVSQGDTRSEALANIREAIELYLQDCRGAGDPIPTEAGKEFVDVDAA